MSIAMPTGTRERFLAEPRVGVLGVTDPRGRRAPLLVPLWFDYQPGGEVVLHTGRNTIKAQLVRAAGRFSLCVQDETPPYRYVSVEGPVTAVEEALNPALRSAIAHRYLDAETATAYLETTKEQLAEDVAFRMRPEHWRTADFSTFATSFS
ncbi:pyridoxamine 5'-phosphate oxidase [Streptomyces sp. AJS327]|uniref:pyridoxamine 5'-phosphate oxidase family protein n=1 Tax=Streptomyces sp. AJS327 TaxID=2545265 RepID=UPI0015DFCBCB|nr:pyridoxamine 5'-phosphate oxidase family protein [Streptomyces sp. AJS327]MBA0050991.1 pyridoxamine 5'-phosphate oxidase [Streptomyces sp. AJS327]